MRVSRFFGDLSTRLYDLYTNLCTITLDPETPSHTIPTISFVMGGPVHRPKLNESSFESTVNDNLGNPCIRPH